MASNFAQIGNYCKEHHVRVVNMSWSDNVDEFEQWLAKSNPEKDVSKRKKLATDIYQVWRSGIVGAISAAPETLFVAAAGNSDSNTGFDQMAPAGLKMPNLITVGAVNQAGEETSFTSYGDTVIVDASGYEVESVVPGGTRLRETGTSMAAPNVANLAAKLFALNPKLTVAQAISLIRRGADASAQGRLHLINPKATVALLKAPGSG
jgi:subtilisin family serine protease